MTSPSNKPFDALLADVRSPDPGVRDEAALALMEAGNPIAVPALLEAIASPENENHTGTLVYALGAFDCRDHVEILVDLVLAGSYEVASGAYRILEGLGPTPGFVEQVEAAMKKDVCVSSSAERIHARAALLDLVSRPT